MPPAISKARQRPSAKNDPLSDIHNTTKIDAVLLRRRMFDRTALDAMLAEIEVEAKRMM